MDQQFEKLGAFYLGRAYDPAAGRLTDELILYDSRDLVTHALCVGMTGSGKTGLCIGLLEEAAIDGVPAVIVDPKGDLANLMLTFPELRPEDFEPWVNAEEAARRGVSVHDYAAEQAAAWKEGLAQWDQDGERIRRLAEAAEVRLYTPGSQAGLPVSILKSFQAPQAAILEDEELLAERVSTAATSLLGLLGIDADPLQSREHILVSTILDRSWREGAGMDLAGLISQIQSPPFERVGVMPVDSFFPPDDRFALATSINNLLAAPKFQAWLEGEGIDIGSALRAPDGRPRLSIFSIAHLNDTERMFFVTLLLGELLGWTRSQPGTTSLRAIFYMDEIAGYFPPIANPPSKGPLLTLLKQARAFGVGVVLATQNPVDLDYKGLSNIGTWFVGRLQTEQDKARLMEGLRGAAGAGDLDATSIDALISELPKRTFLMNNVHEDEPVVFQTRWALSYLAGPATRAQIKVLMGDRSSPGTEAEAAGPPDASPAAPEGSSPRPILPPEVPALYLPARSRDSGESLFYVPRILGDARVRFLDAKAGVDLTREVVAVAEPAEGMLDWDASRPPEYDPATLEPEPDADGAYAPLAAEAAKESSYPRWAKQLAGWLYSTQGLELLRSPLLKKTSMAGESEADFRARLSHEAREKRDAGIEELRKRYAGKARTLEDRLRRAEQAVEREAGQAQQARLQTAVSIGTTVLGAFLGRKMGSGTLGRATTAARGAGRAAQQAQDVTRARENVETLTHQRAELEAELQAEVERLESATDPLTEPLETVTLRPKKADITVRRLALVWEPYLRSETGETTPAR